MEGGAADSSGAVAPPLAAAHYSLPPSRFQSEDILFCVDVDSESRREMKLSGPKGRPITRLDAVKQALLLFVHSKLAINPDHRFALSALSQSVSWAYNVFRIGRSQTPKFVRLAEVNVPDRFQLISQFRYNSNAADQKEDGKKF